MSSNISKIVLIGVMGNGKSSVANIFAGKEIFGVSNDSAPCALKNQSYTNGDIQIFDTEGLNNEKDNVENLQKMIEKFEDEKMNAIFIVHNGEICRIEESLKKMIRQICNLFIGKYIWKQIGIIFTHYGYDEEEQKEMKEREKNFVKQILEIAEDEYGNIIRNQNENDKKCDESEPLVDNLKCFYVNANKSKDQYDANTLQQIEEIKQLARNYLTIDKVQSKFIIKKVVKRDVKGNEKTVLKTEKESGFFAGLKTLGCYGLGFLGAAMGPPNILNGWVYKGIGLAFDNNLLNHYDNEFLNTPGLIPKFFTEIPERLNTKIIGSEVHYDLYDVEDTYYSNGEKEQKIFNVRPQVIKD
jgi:hypothetical protein